MRSRRRLATVVVAWSLWPLGAAAAALPERASVSIDTSDVGDEGPVIKRRIQERTDVVLRNEGLLPARADTDDPIVHVDVDRLEEPGYAFELWVTRGQATVGEHQRVECTLCTETEIVERVEAMVLDPLRELEAPAEGPPAEGPPAEAAPPAGTDQSVVEPRGADDTAPGRAPLGPLGKAGVGMLCTGIAGSIAGAVLIALPPRVNPEDPLTETTTRPPGVAVLSVGVAALVGGAVMLAVDRRRSKRASARGPRRPSDLWVVRF